MKTTFLAILLFFCCICAIAQERSFSTINNTSDGNGRRLALIIGNANYSYTSKLSNPINDAEGMTKALKALGYEVTTSTNTNRQNLKNTINNWGKSLNNNDIALFYYAGHALEVEGVNYLCPIDANPLNVKQVEDETISINLVMGWMENQKTQTNIILLDACRDNPFRSLFRTTGEEGGLSSMKAPSGTFIGFAASPGKKSSDGDGKNGLYTEAILAFIGMPNKTIDQIFNAVNAQVRIRSNGSQVPFKSSSLEADFYFLRKNIEVIPKITGKDLSAYEMIKNAKDFLSKKNYVYAIVWYEMAADLNNTYAMHLLGKLYEAETTLRDYSKAKAWYEKAVDLNYSTAMTDIGQLYEAGLGVQQDYLKAIYWYKKAAEQKEYYAMHLLGNLYEKGLGILQDYSQAKIWYDKAIDLNFSPSMSNLGSLYEKGLGVQQDYSQAKFWYEKASSLEYSPAMYYLGNLYERGLGVHQDYPKAKLLYEKACNLDYSIACNSFKRLNK